MSRRPRASRDPIETQIEAALDPGSFVSYRACWDFVTDLEAVADGVTALVDTDPLRAVALHESFLAGCYEKAEEVDDSGDSLGMFVTDLFCGWVRARQAAGADAKETAARLLAWMDDDPYGFCHRLGQDVVAVLDKAGRAALTEQAEARFAQARRAAQVVEHDRRAGADQRRWAEVLRTLYATRRNVGAYVRLAEDTGVTAADCHAVAKMLSARRKPVEALSWVERGIVLGEQRPGGSADRDLREFQVRLLRKLGRHDEAVETVWTAYRAHPSRSTYDDLMRVVPADQRERWRERVLAAAADAGLRPHMELLLHVKDTDRLAVLVRDSADETLEDVGGYLAEGAATRLEGDHPDAAARLWRARALGLLGTGKSKAYPAALRDLERARRCYDQSERIGAWRQLVVEVRAAHRRKSSFMPAFERLVAGSGPEDEPSFLERAKARWATQDGG